VAHFKTLAGVSVGKCRLVFIPRDIVSTVYYICSYECRRIGRIEFHLFLFRFMKRSVELYKRKLSVIQEIAIY
jgi:hypothetical protein